MSDVETHLLASTDGYTTKGRSPGLSEAECRELEALVHGQPNDAAVVASLASTPTACVRRLRCSGRYAISRILAGQRDTAGRQTIQVCTIVAGAADFAVLAAGDLWSVLHANELWRVENFVSGRPLRLPAVSPVRRAVTQNDVLMVDAWIRARGANAGLVPLSASPGGDRAIVSLAQVLSPADRLAYLWGIRQFAAQAPVQVASFIDPSCVQSSRRATQPMQSAPVTPAGRAAWAFIGRESLPDVATLGVETRPVAVTPASDEGPIGLAPDAAVGSRTSWGSGTTQSQPDTASRRKPVLFAVIAGVVVLLSVALILGVTWTRNRLPGRPTNLRADAAPVSNSLMLRWEAGPGPAPARYRVVVKADRRTDIERATTDHDPLMAIPLPDEDSTCLYGRRLQIQVRAESDSGRVSAEAASVTVVLAPRIQSAGPSLKWDQGTLTLHWKPVPGATQYFATLSKSQDEAERSIPPKEGNPWVQADHFGFAGAPRAGPYWVKLFARSESDQIDPSTSQVIMTSVVLEVTADGNPPQAPETSQGGSGGTGAGAEEPSAPRKPEPTPAPAPTDPPAGDVADPLKGDLAKILKPVVVCSDACLLVRWDWPWERDQREVQVTCKEVPGIRPVKGASGKTQQFLAPVPARDLTFSLEIVPAGSSSGEAGSTRSVEFKWPAPPKVEIGEPRLEGEEIVIPFSCSPSGTAVEARARYSETGEVHHPSAAKPTEFRIKRAARDGVSSGNESKATIYVWWADQKFEPQPDPCVPERPPVACWSQAVPLSRVSTPSATADSPAGTPPAQDLSELPLFSMTMDTLQAWVLPQVPPPGPRSAVVEKLCERLLTACKSPSGNADINSRLRIALTSWADELARAADAALESSKITNAPDAATSRTIQGAQRLIQAASVAKQALKRLASETQTLRGVQLNQDEIVQSSLKHVGDVLDKFDDRIRDVLPSPGKSMSKDEIRKSFLAAIKPEASASKILDAAMVAAANLLREKFPPSIQSVDSDEILKKLNARFPSGGSSEAGASPAELNRFSLFAYALDRARYRKDWPAAKP